MIDLLLDSNTNDIVLKNGKAVAVQDNRDWARQRILVRLRTFLGEWFLNTDFGMPYRQVILKKGTTKSTVDALVIAQINLVEIVESILDFESVIENNTYTCSFRVKVTPESINNVQESLNDEWIYPTPPDSPVPDPEYDGDYIQLSNDLYELIHFSLPLGGSKTWYNVWAN